MRRLTVVGIGLLVIAAFTPAFAESDKVFVVADVPVEAQAGDATTAQRLARDQGRRRAMDILLRRLTAEADWVYLPRLAIRQSAVAGQDAGAGNELSEFAVSEFDFTGKSSVILPEAKLLELEQGFAVANEKSSPTSYSAQVTYRFKPDEVRALLKASRIPYSESQSRAALVLPVLETPSGLYLWESNNPWARAWLTRSLANELTPLILPRGDRIDVETISARQAKSFNQRALRRLAERYEVTQVIIAHGYVSEADGQYRLRVRLLDGYLNNSARVISAIDSGNSSQLYDGEGGFGSDSPFSTVATSAPGQSLYEGWYRDPLGDFPALAARAVESTVSKYAAGWKAQTLIDHTASRPYRVNAWFSSIDEWAGIRRVLDDTPLVDTYDTVALTPDGATVTVRVVGDIEQLVLALRQNNVVFWTIDDYVWNIATTSTYEQVRARVRPASFDPFASGQIGVENNPYGYVNDYNQRLPDAYTPVEPRGTEEAYRPTLGGDFSAPLERELRGDLIGRDLYSSEEPQGLVPTTQDEENAPEGESGE